MRTAEESVLSIHDQLEHFCSMANDFTAEEEKVINCIRSTLMNLREIVKLLDAIKTNDSSHETRKQELHHELNRLSFEISRRFHECTTVPVLQTSRLPSKGLFNPNRHSSLVETLSQVRYILLEALKKEGKFDQKRKEEEGSFVLGDSVLIQGGDLVVFKRHKEQLIQLLLKDDSGTKNVLVTGRRGSGKTTLVRKVCEDVQLRKHFGTIAWISIPPINDPALIRHEIFLQLLFENKAPVPDHLSASDVNDEMLEPQIISLLERERCLIVVDNLVDRSTIKTFQNVSHLVETGRVIFIARRELGPWCSGTHQDGHQLKTYEIKGLSEEESWALFHLKTFPNQDVPLPFKDFREYIVSNCWKLPEVINLFSHLLCNREKEDYERELEDYKWRWMILFPNLVQRVLEVIYQDDKLGSCLLYLSIFPENSPISRMRISRLWTAEGFLNLEEAEDTLQELLNKKWIHPVKTRIDGGFSIFQVDSLVLEIIVSLTDRLNLLRMTNEGCTNWPERVRYLSVQGRMVKDLNEEKLSQLRSLFMFNVSSNKDKTTMSEASPSETSGNQWFQCNAKLLQVLDLTDIPPQIALSALSKSTLLRYFRDTSIKEIPTSIKRLQHLEFLDLKRSLVTELPQEVGGLEKIRHILIYHHEKDPLMESYNLIGFKALCSIEGLKRLEKLCFVEADDGILKDLGTLTKLTRLGITKLRKEDGKTLCTSLEELKELKSLNLHAFDEDEILDLHHLSSPPESLERLYLHGHLDRLPNWISSLCHLTKMVLRWSNLEGAAQKEEDLLATLGKLSKLVELALCQAYNGRQLDFKAGQFPKLKILLLDELGRLRSMSLAKGTMPCLEDLTISRCQWLESMPTGIEQLPKLQALEFFDMSPEFYKMVPDDYRYSEGKPKVYFTQWRPGQWKTVPLGKDRCDECSADEH